MEEARNGYEYLKKLREESGSDRQTFDDLSSYLEKKARATATPLSGQLELTPLCNFDCKMCYVHLEKEQLLGRPILSVDQWKDLIRQAVDAGMLNVTLTGGEALTYPGFEELYLYAQNLGCNVTVKTNGLLMDERRIAFFKAHQPEGIHVTLYGSCDDAYERVTGRRVFRTVCDHIRMAMEAGLPMLVTITPSRFMGEDICDTVRVARRLCPNVIINSALFQPREDTGRAGQQDDVDMDTYIKAQTLLAELNGRTLKEISPDKLPKPGGPSHECAVCGVRCGGGRSLFSVTWQGKMVPCNRFETIESEPLKVGFRVAWSEINKQVNQLARVPECEGCAYEQFCTHCEATLMRFTVPGIGPEAFCRRTVALVQHGLLHIPGCE